jgi:hypothetical protein
MLAAYLTNALVERFPSTPITYFFSKDNIFLQEAHHIVRVIMHQLTIQSPKLRAVVKEIWSTQTSIAELTATGDDFFNILFLPALQSLSQTSTTMFFILDGLNECSQNYIPDVLEFLNRLQTEPGDRIPHLRVLITSQPTREIAIALHAYKRVTLHQ